MRLAAFVFGVGPLVMRMRGGGNSDQRRFGSLVIQNAVDEIIDEILKPFALSRHFNLSSTRSYVCYATRMRFGSFFCREGNVRGIGG